MFIYVSVNPQYSMVLSVPEIRSDKVIILNANDMKLFDHILKIEFLYNYIYDYINTIVTYL